jgi:perosamine synthetase
LHSFYRQRFGTGAGLCPRAEEAYENILSLPIFPGMTDKDSNDVIEALSKVVTRYGIDTRTAAAAGAR